MSEKYIKTLYIAQVHNVHLIFYILARHLSLEYFEHKSCTFTMFLNSECIYAPMKRNTFISSCRKVITHLCKSTRLSDSEIGTILPWVS